MFTMPSGGRQLMKVLGLLRMAMAGGLLSILMFPATADVWSDAVPVEATRLAGEQWSVARDAVGGAVRRVQAAVPPLANAPSPAQSLFPEHAKVLIFFDIFPAYKAVKHHLREAARTHGIDYALLQAIIATESGFDAGAVSPKGAVGLMQLMPATAERFGVSANLHKTVETQLTNPGLNIRAGSRYLSYLLTLFAGQTELAVAAYNAGEGAVRRAGNQIPDFRETQQYVKTVMALYAQLQPPAPALHPSGGSSRVRVELPGGAFRRDPSLPLAPPVVVPLASFPPIEID